MVGVDGVLNDLRKTVAASLSERRGLPADLLNSRGDRV